MDGDMLYYIESIGMNEYILPRDWEFTVVKVF